MSGDIICCPFGNCRCAWKVKRAEQQRAAGIMRALLDTDYLPEEIDAAVEAANDYIAKAEAAQKGDG